MSEQRISVIVLEVDQLWRNYLEAKKKYFSYPVSSFDFCIWAQICDIRKKRYVDAFVSAPKDVQVAQKFFRDRDMKDNFGKIRKEVQPKRRWREIKKVIKNPHNFRKVICDNSIWDAYAE